MQFFVLQIVKVFLNFVAFKVKLLLFISFDMESFPTLFFPPSLSYFFVHIYSNPYHDIYVVQICLYLIKWSVDGSQVDFFYGQGFRSTGISLHRAH